MLLFSESTVFIITIGVQKQTVFGFFSFLFLFSLFLNVLPVFSFSFAVYTVLSENTHAMSIMYNETSKLQ